MKRQQQQHQLRLLQLKKQQQQVKYQQQQLFLLQPLQQQPQQQQLHHLHHQGWMESRERLWLVILATLTWRRLIPWSWLQDRDWPSPRSWSINSLVCPPSLIQHLGRDCLGSSKSSSIRSIFHSVLSCRQVTTISYIWFHQQLNRTVLTVFYKMSSLLL